MDRETVIACYERVVATNPKVERKGDTMPYTSLNGHMFSVLGKDNRLALRLPPDARAAFLDKYNTEVAVMYGCVMPEYVIVPEALLKKTAELKRHFDTSFAYVSTLKPKPTTRKKSSAKKR